MKGDFEKLDKDGSYIRLRFDSNTGKTIITMKPNAFEPELRYSINNGILYCNVLHEATEYNKRISYSFYWWMFQHIQKVCRTIVFVADNCLYKVPYSNFIQISSSMSTSNDVTKRTYLDKEILSEFIVKRFKRNNVEVV